MAAAGGRAEAARGDQASAQRVLAGRGRGLHRGLHGPARRQHRDRRPAHLAADLPRQRRCGDLGGSELPLGSGGHGGRRRSVRRHVGPQAPLHLRLRDLHRRFGPVWAGPEPGPADRVPGPSGRGCRPAAGQQRGHHRAGGAQDVAGQGHRDPRRRPSCRSGPRSHGRRASAGGRRVAAHLLCQRALRAARHDRRGACWSPGAGTSRPGCASTGPDWHCSSRPWWRCSRRSPSGTRRDGPRPRSSGCSWSGLPWPSASYDAKPDAGNRCSICGLFRRSRFSAGIASGMLSYLVMFGVLFLVPFYLERGLQSRLGTGRSRADGHAAGPGDHRAGGRAPG